jgi:CRISPR-associated protein Cas1
MYEMRFPGEDFRSMTMQQLRGREGTRVKKAYRTAAEQYGLQWNGREYDPNDFSSSDSVNQALSVANSCLYGVVQSVIMALGCSPGLGFIHVGHSRSFVYDIADLYKTELTIPLAFKIASENHMNISSSVRRGFRDQIIGSGLLKRIASDIIILLDEEHAEEAPENELFLWDDEEMIVRSGHMYSEP